MNLHCMCGHTAPLGNLTAGNHDPDGTAMYRTRSHLRSGQRIAW